jgi:threonine/homoserine/homoserine lactone efflux protein
MHLIVSLFIAVIVGLVGTIPLGPISIYAAQQTMKGAWVKGLQVCIGSVIVDIIYCLIITMGFISLVYPYLQNDWVQGGLSLFIIAYGIKMLAVDSRKDPEKENDAFKKQRETLERGHYNILLGATMALANPTLFLSWAAVISFITTHGFLADRSWEKVLFSIAIGLGSFLWFFSLVLFVKRKRHSLSPVFVQRAGAATAIVIIGFGVYFTFTIIQKLSGLS